MEDFAGGHNYATIWTMPADCSALRIIEKPDTKRERRRVRGAQEGNVCVFPCKHLAMQPMFPFRMRLSMFWLIREVIWFRYKPFLSCWLPANMGEFQTTFVKFRIQNRIKLVHLSFVFAVHSLILCAQLFYFSKSSQFVVQLRNSEIKSLTGLSYGTLIGKRRQIVSKR